MPLTLDEIRQSIREATCADTKLGNACHCDVIGLGAGQGWKLTVKCGEEVFTWVDPPKKPGEGVQGPTVIDCSELKKSMRETLERLDQERAKAMGVPPQSWKWPASFFLDEQAQPMHQSATQKTDSASWIHKYFKPVPGPPYRLQAGHIVIFEGTSAIDSRHKVSHSAIATGRGDEISHMWWTREIQGHIVDNGLKKDGKFLPNDDDPSPSQGGYAVTRDSLDDISTCFTTPQGKRYLTNSYTVWELIDQGQASFDELKGCATVSGGRRRGGSRSSW